VAGLIAEVVWSRQLAALFGSVLTATGLMLALFMGGLALGSAFGGRIADRTARPFVGYGIAEIVIGVLVALTPSYFRAIAPLVVRLDSRLPDAFAPLIPAVFALVMVGPIVVLMGATFPLLLRHVGVGATGLVYGINTVGAVIGTVAAGFVLLPLLGIQRSLYIAAAADLIVGIVAVVVGLRSAPAIPEQREIGAVPYRFRRWMMVAFLGGAAALTLEVAWFRALMLIFGSSVYALSTMLAAFLLGLSGGSIWVARRVSANEPARLARIHALVAFSATLVTVLLQILPLLFIYLLREGGASFASMTSGTFALVIAALLAPTMLMGAALPIAIRIATAGRTTASIAGAVYAASSLGSAAGALLAGFVLVPSFGVRGAVAAAALASIAAAFASLIDRTDRKQILQITALLAVVWAAWFTGFLPWDWRVLTGGYYAYAHYYAGNTMPAQGPLQRRITLDGDYQFSATAKDQLPASDGKDRLLFWKDGKFAQVAVVEQGPIRSLLLNGKADASTAPDDMRTQLLLGHLPALLSPDPPADTAMCIGLGSGVTAGAVATWNFSTIIAAEIEPAVVSAARFFDVQNRAVLADPRTELRIDDARRTLAREQRPLKLLTSEPTNLWMSGVSLLFTREFFELASSKLDDRGVFCQWIHLYQVGASDVKTLVATLSATFPHVVAFADGADLLLVASRSPLMLDPAVWRQRLSSNPAAAEAMARSGIDGANDLAATIVADQRGLRQWSLGAALHTDDHPILEFTAARQMGYDHSKPILSSLVEAGRQAGPIPLGPHSRVD